MTYLGKRKLKKLAKAFFTDCKFYSGTDCWFKYLKKVYSGSVVYESIRYSDSCHILIHYAFDFILFHDYKTDREVRYTLSKFDFDKYLN